MDLSLGPSTPYAIADAAPDFTSATFDTTCRAILVHCISAPGESASAEEKLRNCPPRRNGESFDHYYARFQTDLETCVFARTLFGETTASGWSFNYYRQWVLNLNVADAYMLSSLVSTTSTFAEVFAAVCRSVQPNVRAGFEGQATPPQERLTNIATSTPPTPPVPDFTAAFANMQATVSDQMSRMDTKLNALSIAAAEPNAQPYNPPPSTRGRHRSRSPSPEHRRRESNPWRRKYN